jgi:diguanylate cyclase (GGDEF)-like protein
VCNTTFHLFYRRFYAARSFLYGQIVVDLLVSIPFLHFSGGIFSYGWIQYPAVVLESALILPSRRDPWLAAGFACLLAVGFAVTEFVGWVTPAPQELYTAAAARHLPSILDRIPWTLGVTLMAAYLGTYLMSTVREREHRLHQAALRDSLTGLYNRVHFARRLQSEVERAKRYGGTPSVIMADLDGFKRVNDTRGHVEGDRVLVTVGKLILSSVRRSDAEPAYDIDVPFRYGGDEFAIIVPGSAPMPSDAQGSPSITPSAGAILAERLRGAVADAMTEYGVTLSAGVATYPLHGVQADELVRSADGYLYEAKRLGGNCVVQGDTNPAERPTR